MSKKILLVGSANMDLSMNMLRVPEAGETLLDDGGVAYLPGGKGANAAAAIARLGGHCVFCTKLGADLHGQKLYEYYKDCGIDTSYVKVDHDQATGLAVVMKEASGENRIVLYPGANTMLSAENVQEAFTCAPDAVYLGFEIPFSVAASAARLAAARGIPVFVDAAPADESHPLDTLPPLEIFSPNETETKTYTGIVPFGTQDCLRAALNLCRKVKCKHLVIKLGSRGAFIYDGKHYDMIPAFRADKVVDTTAAGDAFTAAMTLRYLENGGDIKDAVRYGAAAGALTVAKKGAASSIPSKEEVLAFLERKASKRTSDYKDISIK
jgi:ribokinase